MVAGSEGNTSRDTCYYYLGVQRLSPRVYGIFESDPL